jgi:hypothetical protein
MIARAELAIMRAGSDERINDCWSDEGGEGRQWLMM